MASAAFVALPLEPKHIRVQLLSDISAESKALILFAFRLFPTLVQQVGKFNRFSFPESTWFRLLSQNAS